MKNAYPHLYSNNITYVPFLNRILTIPRKALGWIWSYKFWIVSNGFANTAQVRHSLCRMSVEVMVEFVVIHDLTLQNKQIDKSINFRLCWKFFDYKSTTYRASSLFWDSVYREPPLFAVDSLPQRKNVFSYHWRRWCKYGRHLLCNSLGCITGQDQLNQIMNLMKTGRHFALNWPYYWG